MRVFIGRRFTNIKAKSVVCLSVFVNNSTSAMLESMAISLLEAIRNGDQNTAKWILRHKRYSNLDKQSSKKDGTALFWCCCKGYIELVKLLLLHGADINKCTAWGATPLHASADHNNVDILV